MRSSADVTDLLLQVATPRVRGAVKAEIPHLDDPVKMLEAVGVMTLQKLENISEAARAVGVTNLHVPQNSVETGGHRAVWTLLGWRPIACQLLSHIEHLKSPEEVHIPRGSAVQGPAAALHDALHVAPYGWRARRRPSAQANKPAT